MKVNLNDRFVFGLDVPDAKSNTGRAFLSMGTTESKERFLSFTQYILDNFCGPDKVVIIHTETQCVFDLDSVAACIGLKSKKAVFNGRTV